MKISYKEADDKLSCEVCVDDKYAGTVDLNVYNQKWFLTPAFKAVSYTHLRAHET